MKSDDYDTLRMPRALVVPDWDCFADMRVAYHPERQPAVAEMPFARRPA